MSEDPSSVPLAAAFAERYERLGLLGEGAMGEVRLCRDRVIGREVAMKVIKSVRVDSPHRWRFIREARVQGQLEHPAIVPVYDLGVSPEGHPFFTMKRLHGESFGQVLEKLRAGDPEAPTRWTRKRMLRMFATVCLAVDFAHARGVVHRDLKPDNLMLGEYGEIYVLDWGIAKLLAEAVQKSEARLLDASRATRTDQGSVLGTPGYMSPEQLRGEVAAVSSAADVYSLGALLFELLTLRPLHDQERMQDKLISVLQTDGARPSERGARVNPALDAACREALRLDAARRPTARALHDIVEGCLDAG
ncbi:MAG: serine/threonine-protein kinase [Sandaracinaceae bacterium]